MKEYKRYVLLAVLILALAGIVYAQQGYIIFTQGAQQLLVRDGGEVEVQDGGELNVESGGELDIESGGALQIAGTAISSSAAELNYNDGVTPGTVTVSKTLMAGAAGQLDALTITALTTSSIQAEAKDYVVASDDTLYAAGTYNTSGTSFLARPIAAKYEIELQAGAVAGDWFEVYVADTDSLRIRAATGDSLIAADGSASNVLGTVQGSAKFTMLLADKWFIQNATGTWTASLN